MVTPTKILKTDPVAFVVFFVTDILVVAMILGVMLRPEPLNDNLPLLLSVLCIWFFFMFMVFLRVKYLRWLLSYNFTERAVLNKEDRRYIINGVVGCICYTYKLNGKNQTTYASFILSKKFREFLAKSGSVTVCVYPKYKLSVIKEAYE